MRIFRKTIFFGLLLSLLLSVGCKQEEPRIAFETSDPDWIESYHELKKQYPILEKVAWGEEGTHFTLEGSIAELKELLCLGKAVPMLLADEGYSSAVMRSRIVVLRELTVPRQEPQDLQIVSIHFRCDAMSEQVSYIYRGALTFWNEETQSEETGEFRLQYIYYSALSDFGSVREYAAYLEQEVNSDGVLYHVDRPTGETTRGSVAFDLEKAPGIGMLIYENTSGTGTLPYEQLLEMAKESYLPLAG